MRAPRIRLSAVSLLSGCAIAACSFDTTGNGFPDGMSVGALEGSGTDDDSPGADQAEGAASGTDEVPSSSAGERGETQASDTPGDTGDGGTGPTGSDGDDADGDAGAAASSSGGDVEETTGDVPEPIACPVPVFELVWAAAGELIPPMTLVETDAEGNPEVAYSTITDSGALKLTLDFACPGEYALWGLVWDYMPGAHGGADPDSFYFDVGGDESTWRYGCQTADEESGLSWQRIAALSAQPCNASYVALQVAEAGPVELTLRNREAGSGSVVAGIAAVVVSSDLAADPSALYEPY